MKFSFITALSLLTGGPKTTPLFNEAYVCKTSEEQRPVMVTCDSHMPCPKGSQCIKLYGDSGFCVLTKMK